MSLSVTFKLINHITGLVLAFLTRKVKIDPLNNSKFLAIVIYVSTVFLVVALVIIFVVEESDTYAGIWTTFVLIEVCMFLGMNFIPKVKFLCDMCHRPIVFCSCMIGEHDNSYSLSLFACDHHYLLTSKRARTYRDRQVKVVIMLSGLLSMTIYQEFISILINS